MSKKIISLLYPAFQWSIFITDTKVRLPVVKPADTMSVINVGIYISKFLEMTYEEYAKRYSNYFGILTNKLKSDSSKFNLINQPT